MEEVRLKVFNMMHRKESHGTYASSVQRKFQELTRYLWYQFQRLQNLGTLYKIKFLEPFRKLYWCELQFISLEAGSCKMRCHIYIASSKDIRWFRIVYIYPGMTFSLVVGWKLG